MSCCMILPLSTLPIFFQWTLGRRWPWWVDHSNKVFFKINGYASAKYEALLRSLQPSNEIKQPLICIYLCLTDGRLYHHQFAVGLVRLKFQWIEVKLIQLENRDWVKILRMITEKQIFLLHFEILPVSVSKTWQILRRSRTVCFNFLVYLIQLNTNKSIQIIIVEPFQ